MAIHVVARLGGWAVRRSRAKRALKLFRLKCDAVSFARKLAGGTNFFTHRIDGTIEQLDHLRSGAGVSTVAWDGKTLAADRQGTHNDMAHIATKLRETKDGGAMAFVGCIPAGCLMMDWYDAGADLKNYPDFQRDKDLNCFLIVVSNERVVVEYTHLPIACKVHEACGAWGSGRDYALGAMAAGANAAMAVKIASQFDINTGMGLDAFDIP